MSRLITPARDAVDAAYEPAVAGPIVSSPVGLEGVLRLNLAPWPFGRRARASRDASPIAGSPCA